MTVEQLQAKLPKDDFYYSSQLAEAFGVTRYTIQRAALKHGIGKIKPRENGARGVRLFTPQDIKRLCKVIHPLV